VAIVRDEALILRVMRYRETSKIVVALTPAFGKVHLLAKGAREYKRGFGGALEILTRAHLVFYHQKQRDLHLLHSASVEQPYLRLLSPASVYHLACAALEFVLRVLPDEDPAGEIYHTLAAFLERGDAEPSPGEIYWALRVFQFRTVALLGYAPQLTCCAVCGEAVPGAATFGVAEGGLLCARCRPQGETRPLSPGALDVLRSLVTHAGSAGAAAAGEGASARGGHPAFPPVPRRSAGLDRQVADVVECFLRYHVTGYQGLRSLKSLSDWRTLQRAAGRRSARS